MALKDSAGPSSGGGDGSLWMSIVQMLPEGAAETLETNTDDAINEDSRGLKREIMLYVQDA